ncbi:MAG TPA: hypothetical protein VEL76_32300, partial [Gemmataceae bacterium]|nr:hypothetical protein [Gemmataceae bacterium]
PLLVAWGAGKGRTMVFGADTTWRAWRRPTPDFKTDSIKAYERFWKQVILWLAHREDADGNVRVMPDVRRVAAGGHNRVGFTVEARGKGGLLVPDAVFKVKVIGPNKEEFEVAIAQEDGKERGYFWKTDKAGDYQIEVQGFSKDGKENLGLGKAKFLAYAEDLENQRPAADHEFLRKLAAAGGGTAYLGGEDRMVEFLETLLGQPLLPTRGRAEEWPDWKLDPGPDAGFGDQVAAFWASGLLACFVLFVAFLCAEWYLRRRWGMV